MSPLPALAIALALLAAPAPADPRTPAEDPRDPTQGPPALTGGPGEGPRASGSRWGLVLSGGGARGLAHIGVLRALEEHLLRPDLVVGTSMGAIIGSLYASGRSSAEIAELMREVGWTSILFPRSEAFSWRGQVTPRPLLRLAIGRRGPRFPTAALDDAFLNFRLSSVLLESNAAANGDFDRLVVPFRAVATDLATARPVVLGSGDLARAVRASMAIPLLLPPVPHGSRLLIDGGFASNVPVSAAKQAGVGRVIAVDVSKPTPVLDEDSPATTVLGHLLDILVTRGQTDTTETTDLLVRLPMRGYGSMSYADSDSLIALGYRGSVAGIRAFADSVGLPRGARPRRAEPILLPPIASAIQWQGLRNQTITSANAALGKPPAGRFFASELQPALTRLYESGLFQSAWPGLEHRGDSTLLGFEVREEPARELALAGAYGNDEGARGYARLATRTPVLPFFRLADVTGTHREDRTAAQLNLERYALARGGSGGFARAEYLETRTRIFRQGDVVGRPRTIRRGAYVGAQAKLPTGHVAHLAGGWASIGEGARRWNAPALVVRTEAQGAIQRTAEGEWVLGPDGFGSAGVHFEIAPTFGRLIVRPVLRAGLVSGDPPSDALVGLGGPRSLSGIHAREWLGRRYVAGNVLAIFPVGAALSLVASGEVGAVGGVVSAPEIRQRLQVAGGLGLDVVSPFGPLRLQWGIGPEGRSRVDLMLGERF